MASNKDERKKDRKMSAKEAGHLGGIAPHEKRGQHGSDHNR